MRALAVEAGGPARPAPAGARPARPVGPDLAQRLRALGLGGAERLGAPARAAPARPLQVRAGLRGGRPARAAPARPAPARPAPAGPQRIDRLAPARPAPAR